MAEERRKGPPERRRSRAANPTRAGEAGATGTPAAEHPNDSPAIEAAERLDESIRSRQQEDRGEVF